MGRTLNRMLVALAMWSVLACGRSSGRSGRALRAALGGLWLGVLDEDDLTELDERYYRRDATYRTDAWNERGLDGWERRAVEQAFAPGDRIVVPACGGGREVLALLEAGFDAVGYESHPQLRAYAERFLAEHGHPGSVRAVERDRWPGAERCDGILLGWGAYSLIAPRERRLAFLASATGAMSPGRAVVLSCFEQPERGRELRLTFTLANRLRRWRRAAPVELGDVLAPNRVHVFTPGELAQELREAGWTVAGIWRTGRADPTTSYVCAIGRIR